MKKKKQKYKLETEALHAGYDYTETIHQTCGIPLYPSVANIFKSSQHAANLFALKEEGHIYARIDNPTCAIFERRMAALEQGEAALSTSSGMAAIFMTIVHLAKNGDEIVSSNKLYGGVFHLFRDTLKNFGITTYFVTDPHNITAWEKLITKKNKMLTCRISCKSHCRCI